MRKSFLMTASGDYDISSGKRVLITSDDEIIKRLRFRIKRFFGEWFLDNTKGIDYLNQFLIKNPNLLQCELTLRNEISQTEGISKIISLKITPLRTQRTMKVNFTVETINANEITIEDTII